MGIHSALTHDENNKYTLYVVNLDNNQLVLKIFQVGPGMPFTWSRRGGGGRVSLLEILHLLFRS